MDSELALQQIRRDQRCGAGYLAGHLVPPNRPDSVLSHDPSHSLATDTFACFAKIQEHPWTPVDPSARVVRRTDELEEPLVFNRPVREGSVNPGVEAARSDFQDVAHRANRESVTLRVDERVLYSDSLAKYAAAFFSMSRSS